MCACQAVPRTLYLQLASFYQGCSRSAAEGEAEGQGEKHGQKVSREPQKPGRVAFASGVALCAVVLRCLGLGPF